MDSRIGIASLGTITLGAAGGLAGIVILTVTGVVVAPAGPVTIERAGTQQFTATVNGGARQEVFWWASRGTITQSGLYTAPADYTQDAAAEVRAYAAADWFQFGTAAVSIEPRRYLASAFTNGDSYQRLYESDDGLNFRKIPLTLPPLWMRDPAIVYWAGAWYVVRTKAGGFVIYRSTDLVTWILYQNITLAGPWLLSWAPTWFIDVGAGTLHIIVNLTNVAWKGSFFIYETHPTAADLSTWSVPVWLLGAGGDCFYDGRVVQVGAEYRLAYKDHNAAAAPLIQWASAPALTGPYALQGTIAGGAGLYYEAACPVLLPDGVTWRCYFDDYANTWNLGSTKYVDSLDDWATWGALPADILSGEALKHADVYEPPILALPAPAVPPVPPAPPVIPTGSWPFGFFPSRWLSGFGGAR